MKKLILLLALAFAMCGCNKHIENTFRVGTVDYNVIVIDDCEYLKAGTVFTHKGNCKYCAERRKKELEKSNPKRNMIMKKEELIQFLKENLTVEVCHPNHDVGYYSSCMEPDEHNITVEIRLCGETICKDTSN